MRSMILLYLNSSPIPFDIKNDMYLSPIKAPNEILQKFPRTFFLTGEKDPLGTF